MKTTEDEYWNNRYNTKETQWDLRSVSPPLKGYIDQLEDKDVRILIPGCGNAYEAEYLLENGFTNITLVDISALLVEELQQKIRSEKARIIHGNFFDLDEKFDLVLEQTFFCAIDPSLRKSYVAKMHELLQPGGKIAGVMFNREFEGGPPFGGTAAEYKALFEPAFKIRSMAECYNSIEPRKGTEAFVIFER